MLRQCLQRLLAGFTAISVGLLCSGEIAMACEERARSEDSSSLTLSLSDDCTEAEQQARTIHAKQLMDALRRGKTIMLSGVMLQDDLVLDSLPVGPVPSDLANVDAIPDKEVRIISGAISIVNSRVRGAIRHRSTEKTLVFRGPVNFAGTRFDQAVDLSRSVFLQPVTLSGAIFLGEGYFMADRFLTDVHSEKTAYGPHTRFHRAHFYGSATFQQSGFSGLAEFLEVRFDKVANFSRTYFKQGTGFSGTRFGGMADFSEALFDREAFFPFAVFVDDAYFRRATFRSTADFSQVEFQGRDDFAKVLFERSPEFSGIKRNREKEPLGLENPKIQYLVTLSLLLFSALLLVYLIKSK